MTNEPTGTLKKKKRRRIWLAAILTLNNNRPVRSDELPYPGLPDVCWLSQPDLQPGLEASVTAFFRSARHGSGSYRRFKLLPSL